MKKLQGMKKNFSSLENKKMKRSDLKSINGAIYAIESNFAPAGCYEADQYESNGGKYIMRITVC